MVFPPTVVIPFVTVLFWLMFFGVLLCYRRDRCGAELNKDRGAKRIVFCVAPSLNLFREYSFIFEIKEMCCHSGVFVS